MNKIQTLMLLTFFLIFPKFINAQFKNSIGIHILPWATSESVQATGLYIDYSIKFKKNNLFLNFGYGIIYDNYDQPTYSYNFQGHSEKWSTEIEASNIPYPNQFWLPDPTLINDINSSGFTNHKIYNSYRIDHFLNFNLGYHFKFGKKWTFSPSGGILLGMADRTIVGGATTATLYAGPGVPHPFVPEDLTFWIVFQLRGKYMYTGYNVKFDLDRKLSSRFSLGFSTGCNFSVRKDFGGEQQFIFTGLNAKAYF